jgi:hypothetical protein
MEAIFANLGYSAFDLAESIPDRRPAKKMP